MTCKRVLKLPAVLIITAALTPLASAQRAASDWTQWRGPNRDGSVPFTPPQTWPEMLTRRWTVDIGSGYATPLVVGNRVYVFSRQRDNETMSALDVESGKVLWSTGYPVSFEMHSATVQHGPGPKSTPVFADGKLFAIGMTGVVTAYDANTGRQLWQKPGSTPVPMFTTHSFSPLSERGIVVFHVGGHDEGALTAFDMNTGEVRWSWRGDGPGYGSPVIADLAGTRQIITITQSKLVSVDAASGALLWERPFVSANFTNSITPLLHGELLIVSGNGGPTHALRVTRRDGTWTTDTLWENADVPLRFSNMVVVNDVIFGLTTRNSGQYFALDAKTGKTLWTSEGRQAGNAALAKSGGTVFSLEDDGELIVARGTPAGLEIVKRYKLADTATWTQAVYSGNRIFVKDVSNLTLWTVN